MAEQEKNTLSPHVSLSAVVIPLLKGVLYQADDSTRWNDLLALQSRVRDYVAVLGLELALDESEGYAFLRSLSEPVDGSEQDLPRLIVRRQVSFPVSHLLALLRRKLAEFDAGGGETRLVLTRDDIVELIRVFLPESSNEVKLVDQIETHINKTVELVFLRRLRTSIAAEATNGSGFEVQRILKAFVDAQWLSEFDAHLA